MKIIQESMTQVGRSPNEETQKTKKSGYLAAQDMSSDALDKSRAKPKKALKNQSMTYRCAPDTTLDVTLDTTLKESTT